MLSVTWFKRDQIWQPSITFKQKKRHLGYFKSEEEAAQTYNNMAKKCFGDFATFNNINKENKTTGE